VSSKINNHIFKNLKCILGLGAVVFITGPACQSGIVEESVVTSPYAAWKNGPPSDPGFFPIGVWMQKTENAPVLKKAGINTYIALWGGVTEEDLERLRAAGLHLICHPNQVAKKHLDDPVIIAWLQPDEPDNAQPDGKGGWGPCMDPARIQANYQAWKKMDPTRPVYMGLGQAVSFTDWVGRGVCRGKIEMYPEYIKGTDIASFDIYPVYRGMHQDFRPGKAGHPGPGKDRSLDGLNPRCPGVPVFLPWAHPGQSL
jgi:hypothetical protein